MLRRTASFAATFGAVTMALMMGATSAVADPTFVPDSTDIVGVGDPTTQVLMNAAATAYNSQEPAPADLLASYDATGSTSIVAKEGCTQIARPLNTTQGVQALVADTAGCLDFARSRRVAIVGEEALSFLPYGFDGISWAVASESNAPESLSRVELAAIYRCTARKWVDVGGTSTQLIRPYLPPRSSFDRGFFLNAIGVGAPGSCVLNGTTKNQLLQKPMYKKRNFISPLTIPEFIQLGPAPADPVNHPRLGSVETADGTPVPPTVGPAEAPIFNTAFPERFIRPVYNVVERDETGDVPARLDAIFGFSGYLCSDAGQAVVVQKGFGSLPQADGCGIG